MCKVCIWFGLGRLAFYQITTSGCPACSPHMERGVLGKVSVHLGDSLTSFPNSREVGPIRSGWLPGPLQE